MNGEYLGIYSNVESITKPFLQRRFKNSKGNLYEGTLADFYPHALDRVEVKTNKQTTTAQSWIDSHIYSRTWRTFLSNKSTK